MVGGVGAILMSAPCLLSLGVKCILVWRPIQWLKFYKTQSRYWHCWSTHCFYINSKFKHKSLISIDPYTVGLKATYNKKNSTKVLSVVLSAKLYVILRLPWLKIFCWGLLEKIRIFHFWVFGTSCRFGTIRNGLRMTKNLGNNTPHAMWNLTYRVSQIFLLFEKIE